MAKQNNLKVAIVAELLVKNGGAEKVVKKLSEMYPDAPVYTLLYDEEVCGKDFPKERIRPSFLQNFPSFIRKRYRFLLTLMPYAVESLDFSEYDLVISSSSAFAHGCLTGTETTHVCYCHSPMRYAWDYTHEYLKSPWFGPVKRFFASRSLKKIRLWDKVASDRPDMYIANSKHVTKRIEKYYRLPSELCYPPVDVSDIKLSKDSEDFYLIISTLSAYKKIDLAVSLFNKIGKKLVIVGDGPEKRFLQSIAGDNITFTGYLSDEKCHKLREKCRAFIFPSEEDFGISMIEALATGKPVLAYKAGGAIEFIEPGVNGEFFGEQSVGAMEDALGKLILNRKKYDAKKIRASAERFSSERFEKEFTYLVKKALE